MVVDAPAPVFEVVPCDGGDVVLEVGVAVEALDAATMFVTLKRDRLGKQTNVLAPLAATF